MQRCSQMHGTSFAGIKQNVFVKPIDMELCHCLPKRTAGIAEEVMGPLGMMLENFEMFFNAKLYSQNYQFSAS